MKNLILISLFVFSACQNQKTPEVKTPAEITIHPDVATKNLKCIGMNDKILRAAYTEDRTAIDPKEVSQFPKDEKTSLDFIQQMDLNLLMPEENLAVIEYYNKNCEEHLSGRPQFQICDYKFNLLFYMRGLLYGLNHYNWSPKTKLAAKDKLLAYIRFMAQKKSDLVDKSIAATILKYMIETKVLPEKLLNDALVIDQYSLEVAESFKARSKDMKVCDQVRANFDQELKASQAIGEKIIALLNRI